MAAFKYGESQFAILHVPEKPNIDEVFIALIYLLSSKIVERVGNIFSQLPEPSFDVYHHACEHQSIEEEFTVNTLTNVMRKLSLIHISEPTRPY